LSVVIRHGDCREILRTLPDESVHCVVTSPPYFGLRDYGTAGQLGQEETPGAFVAEMVAVFREVRRVLRKDGTLWLNLGDSYANLNRASGGKSEMLTQTRQNTREVQGFIKANAATIPPGLKPKDLIGIPWRVAFALQADGWWLRQDIIWHKPNPMPESVRDRCTKAHEYLFLLTKSERYWYDAAAIKEENSPTSQMGGRFGDLKKTDWVGNGHSGLKIADNTWDGRNRRSVWTITTQPFPEAHFATFPPELPELCIKAGCPVGGTVLDPFAGAGTTGLVADRLGRDAILIELNPDYSGMAHQRIVNDAPLFAAVATV
jgi:DNA modification methylase